MLDDLHGGDRLAPILPAGSILVARDLPPSRFLEIAWSPGSGLALMGGSPTAHLAILARNRGLPVVIGLGAFTPRDGAVGLLDGGLGELLIDPSDGERSDAAARRLRPPAPTSVGQIGGPTQTATGDRIEVLININGPEDLVGLEPSCCDGIGLVRTEFMAASRLGLTDEGSQVAAYRARITWAAGLALDRFAVDFASIGSNDLVQYVMAAGRDVAALASLADATQPAVLELMRLAITAANRRGLPIGLCGDVASDCTMLSTLLQSGLRSLSVAPRGLCDIKAAIATISIGERP